MPPTSLRSIRPRRSWQPTRAPSTSLLQPVHGRAHRRPQTRCLTADSPQRLIDQMSVQRVMASEMSAQMTELPHADRRTGRYGRGRLGASRPPRPEDRGRAGRRGARRPAVQAEPAAGPDCRGQVAVPGADPEPAAGSRLRLPPAPATCPTAPERCPTCRRRDLSINAMPAPGDDGAAERRCRRARRISRAAIVGPGRADPDRLAVLVGRRSGPNAFDCSGLVMWAFQQAGISLPHSSQALAAWRPAGRACRRCSPVTSSRTTPTPHTSAMYIGDGMMVHASTYGTPVRWPR